jgi:type IV pilus assembly protein PilA
VQLLHSIKSRRDAEEGFTLIELMVVVLIIAILIAIAIPTFLGARQRAQNSAAKSDLRNALAAAKTFYTDTETYTGMDPAALDDIEPSLDYVTGAGTKTEVGIDVGATGDDVCLGKVSKSGDNFSLLEDVTAGGGTSFYKTLDCSGAEGW